MKNTHFLITREQSDVRTLFLGAFIAKVDGSKATSLKDFYQEISTAMHFPEHDGKNLDALDEMLNDLEWIKEQKVIIYIENSADWLAREKSEEKLLSVIDILDATAEDWKWMDEEEEGTPKKELQIVFHDSERIRTLLDEQEIPYWVLS
ncbi:barstar family protein [Dyadobacter sp. CY327]|uniref:barstar family protein n=1 Tax=Dyadobacter sp. CY327 TaxID=2907301 RepID=UPI001F2AB8E0|nr:barstar family protein [Dyadobacter sp. CY327]MCE7073578.1 barstar family protein [Dyadobacter sp. CY327]